MTEPRVTTKTELLAAIDRSWASLNSLLDRLTEAQMTTLKDAQGWAVKDHIIHMTAWERSVVFFLQGRPRSEGLAIDEALYQKGSEDDINAFIFRERKDLRLSDALETFRAIHAELMELLRPLSEADLQKPYRYYLPDEAGEEDGPPALDVVSGNTSHHFMQHQQWIETLVNKPSG